MTIYLKIKGIDGQVNVSPYENSILINSYHIEAKRAVHKTDGMMQNRLSGYPQYHSLMMTKSFDTATTDFLTFFYDGSPIPKLTFYHVTTGVEPICYLENSFYDVIIGRYQENNQADGSHETYELYFSKHEKRAMPLDKTNKPTPPKAIGFDLEKISMI